MDIVYRKADLCHVNMSYYDLGSDDHYYTRNAGRQVIPFSFHNGKLRKHEKIPDSGPFTLFCATRAFGGLRRFLQHILDSTLEKRQLLGYVAAVTRCLPERVML